MVAGPEILENAVLCVPRPSVAIASNKPVIVKQSLPPSTIHPNHVLIKVDRFGFSTNNLTYQALGEHPHFRYFDYHAVPENDEISSTTHGVVPVWGFGTVVKSSHPKIEPGERVYGYFAPARYLLLPVSANNVNKSTFYIPRPHLPADRRPYNQVLRCAHDSQYSPEPLLEDLTMLYRPLFWTAYWCEDCLFSSSYRGGTSRILISSASSKTAFCLAYLLQKRIKTGGAKATTQIIGLTSRRNFPFTTSLDLYHDVLTYDTFKESPLFHGGAEERWIYVDVAANQELNQTLFTHFASPYSGRLASFISLGLTNVSPTSSESSNLEWNEDSARLFSANSQNPRNARDTSQFWPLKEEFFMPEWLAVRRHQLPLEEILKRQNNAWKELMRDCVDWVKIERRYGIKNVKEAYELLLQEGIGPDTGLIWSLWNDEDKHLVKPRL
ncbi:hypothetical protein AMATHDRAFT_144700 [Amanita thiersii Skay4041]|uniref:DUF2855 family protein n=1 Tax=Amanita thiersii Skay4041 TaxID=703135 RepID=A0A2A9NSE1_9AGAR|nr:hypothetical protein AMATHDRAFT_144700 [Amanita thiersii Skay4041]